MCLQSVYTKLCLNLFATGYEMNRISMIILIEERVLNVLKTISKSRENVHFFLNPLIHFQRKLIEFIRTILSKDCFYMLSLFFYNELLLQ